MTAGNGSRVPNRLGMVFAAGLGTRLRPLTDRLPKPVVPLMNRPLASYSLERLAAAGVTHCAVNKSEAKRS